MSLLAPLFVLGALAVSLPVLLHLIRRTPRGRQPFSSLMFLSPSPPRITKRSRIEHWLLLLMRAAAIVLLALAFSRPFFRETANLMLDNTPGQRLAIVVDASASMRREDLWRQAVARVERLVNGVGPADAVGLFVYDDSVRTLVDWDEPLPDHTARQALLRQALVDVSPSWGGSNLGQALVTVADRLMMAASERRDARSASMIVITDLQHGSNTAALQAYEWPTEIMVQVETVRAASQDNAGIRLLEADEQPGWRVRVENAPGSTVEQFRVGWASGNVAAPAGESLELYVPAGQSRIARLSTPPPGVDRVQLSGDVHDFDNSYFFSPVQKREIRVAYIGRDQADDPHGLRYFLDRVWTDTSHRTVSLEAWTPDTAFESATTGKNLPRLIVVAAALPKAALESFQSYVREGGSALVVAGDPETAACLAQLDIGVDHLSADPSVRTKSNAFALLSNIDFSHPMFAQLAGPKYNDFTKVRIWKHQRFVMGDSAKVRLVAQFDDGDPAIWEQQLGSGKLLWMACGWRPGESQLALSSKFVPILSRTLDHLMGIEQSRSLAWRVGQPIELPLADQAGVGKLLKPNGQSTEIPASTKVFHEADQPGVYRYERGPATADIAVNLDPAESETAVDGADRLDQLGVRVGRRQTQAEQLARQRQLRDTELESRQKLWRWMLVGVLGVLALETVFAGRLARTESSQIESREITS